MACRCSFHLVFILVEIVTASDLISDKVDLKPTKEDLNLLASSLTRSECSVLVSRLKTHFEASDSKSVSSYAGDQLLPIDFDCFTGLDKVMSRLPLVQAYPTVVKHLQYLNRSDVAHYINKQYLHANVDIVKTYMNSMNLRDRPSESEGSFVSDPRDSDYRRQSSVGKSRDDHRIFVTPEFFFIYALVGLNILLLACYLICRFCYQSTVCVGWW